MTRRHFYSHPSEFELNFIASDLAEIEYFLIFQGANHLSEARHSLAVQCGFLVRGAAFREGNPKMLEVMLAAFGWEPLALCRGWAEGWLSL